MADYMGYWQNDAVDAAAEQSHRGQLFDHSVSTQFGKVRPGDTVWIVNIELGTHRFRLVGRLQVGKVCKQKEAVRILGRSNLYDGPYHLIAIHGSEEPIRDIDLDPVARQIRFASPKPSDRLAITKKGVDQQQVRRLRTLTPETVDLFEQLWRDASGSAVEGSGDAGEERIPAREYLEGGAVRLLVNRYERDAQARTACIAHHGCTCQICGMDFGSVYGDLGEGFIHVHHLVPLSSRGKRYQVKPDTELLPVCPNCHAMLHTGDPPPTVDQLRRIVAANRVSR